MTPVAHSQTVASINRRFLKKRIELFQPLFHAIARFDVDKDFDPLADTMENVFTAWYPGNFPSFSEIENNKELQKTLKASMVQFVKEAQAIASVYQHPLTLFWRKNILEFLELTYLPTKKTFFSRVTQFVRRWKST